MDFDQAHNLRMFGFALRTVAAAALAFVALKVLVGSHHYATAAVLGGASAFVVWNTACRDRTSQVAREGPNDTDRALVQRL